MTRLYYLSNVEKQVLFRKYTGSGLTNEEANQKIQDIVSYLKKLVTRLESKNKTTSEIDRRFKEAFEKICQGVEGKYG